MSQKQQLIRETVAANGKGSRDPILSSLLRGINNMSVDSHSPSSQINILNQKYLRNSESLVFMHETSVF